MNISEKKQIIQDLHERFAKSAVVIVTDYKGLDVAAVTKLRRLLSEAGVEYQVVKNTLLVRASEETDVARIQALFKGPSAIALSYQDPVAPAKVLSQFAKENDKLEIKGGVLQGKVLDMAGVKALADLPSREVLLSQVLGALNAVPAGFVRTLNVIPVGLLNVLNAIKEQKEAA